MNAIYEKYVDASVQSPQLLTALIIVLLFIIYFVNQAQAQQQLEARETSFTNALSGFIRDINSLFARIINVATLILLTTNFLTFIFTLTISDNIDVTITIWVNHISVICLLIFFIFQILQFILRFLNSHINSVLYPIVFYFAVVGVAYVFRIKWVLVISDKLIEMMRNLILSFFGAI